MKSMRGPRTTQVLATTVAVLALTALAGCSSDSNDSSSTDSTASASAANLPADAFAGKAAAGESVKIGLITAEGGQATSQPELREAAQAATQYANDNLGGIGGRPVELVICKSLEEPVSARDCANQMVEAKVSAVVATATSFGNIIVPVLAGAGIPYASALAGTAAETTTDGAFVWTAGANTTQAMAAYAGEQGWTKVTAYGIDVPASIGSLTLVGQPAFETAGVDMKVIPIPFGTPDASPQVSAGLATSPDGVVILGESTVCTSVLKSLSTLGSTAKIMTVQSCVAPEVVDAVGSTLDGAKIFTSADTESDKPESALYRAIMAKYSPETPTSGYAVAGYQGVLGLVRATTSVQGADTSPAALMAAIKSAKDVAMPAGDGITFTCNGQAIAGFPSVCSNGLVALTMEDGKQTDPQNVFIK